MNLIKMARQLLAIADDLRKRRPAGVYDFEAGELYDFDQTWASTALGFGGIGGAALTTERTYVFIPIWDVEHAYVYFGGEFAYKCPVCDSLMKDIENKYVASVANSGQYKQEVIDDCT